MEYVNLIVIKNLALSLQKSTSNRYFNSIKKLEK